MKQNGFTLIETIVSVTIFTVIIAAVYSAFNIGINTWRRSQENQASEKIRVAFLKMENELKKSFFFSKALFKGAAEEIVFPLVASTGEKDVVNIVTYDVVMDDKIGSMELFRKEEAFSADAGGAEAKVKKLIPSAKSIRFGYGSGPKDASGYFEWQDSWDSEKEKAVPAGVKVSVEMNGAGDIYNKIIFLQQGKLGEE